MLLFCNTISQAAYRIHNLYVTANILAYTNNTYVCISICCQYNIPNKISIVCATIVHVQNFFITFCNVTWSVGALALLHTTYSFFYSTLNLFVLYKQMNGRCWKSKQSCTLLDKKFVKSSSSLNVSKGKLGLCGPLHYTVAVDSSSHIYI